MWDPTLASVKLDQDLVWYSRKTGWLSHPFKIIKHYQNSYRRRNNIKKSKIYPQMSTFDILPQLKLRITEYFDNYNIASNINHITQKHSWWEFQEFCDCLKISLLILSKFKQIN